ncbi:hypothetical protein C5167_024683 [Papaver somniferum]|uniref:Thioredoxin domain-containing protein n=1 Tax=Papaver somniferum TaxID=3469 RepID=A0A4Y7JQW0_PAPSO|nr:hypothetical protein C5167_024683 [Papaver somniferum]
MKKIQQQHLVMKICPVVVDHLYPSLPLAPVRETFKMFQSRDDDEDSYHHKVNFASGNVHLITTQERWEEKLAEAKRDSKIIVANFSASWCGPCRMLAPLFGELSEKYPTLMFLTVDVDDLPELSSSLDIRATPTFFFLKDGQQIDKLVGANKLELLKKIPAALDSAKQS